MSVLEKAGIADPLKVFDGKGHVQETMFRDFMSHRDIMEESHKEEIGRHLKWCKKCQERQKQEFLPLSPK